jgi:hypothetical protein
MLPILERSCASILPSYLVGWSPPPAAPAEYIEKKEFVRPLFSVFICYSELFTLRSGVGRLLITGVSLADAPNESFMNWNAFIFVSSAGA